MDTFLDQHLTKFIERLEEEAPESRSLAYAVMFSTAWDRLSPAVQRLVDLQRRLKVKFNVEV